MSPLASNSTGTATHAVNHNNQTIKPEWLRVPEAIRLFGIGRSSLYELITAGTIKSTSLKKRGALRGIRLISYDSLSAYIESCQMEGGR